MRSKFANPEENGLLIPDRRKIGGKGGGAGGKGSEQHKQSGGCNFVKRLPLVQGKSGGILKAPVRTVVGL